MHSTGSLIVITMPTVRRKGTLAVSQAQLLVLAYSAKAHNT